MPSSAFLVTLAPFRAQLPDCIQVKTSDKRKARAFVCVSSLFDPPYIFSKSDVSMATTSHSKPFQYSASPSLSPRAGPSAHRPPYARGREFTAAPREPGHLPHRSVIVGVGDPIPAVAKMRPLHHLVLWLLASWRSACASRRRRRRQAQAGVPATTGRRGRSTARTGRP
jgi:hypothetical protein